MCNQTTRPYNARHSHHISSSHFLDGLLLRESEVCSSQRSSETLNNLVVS